MAMIWKCSNKMTINIVKSSNQRHIKTAQLIRHSSSLNVKVNDTQTRVTQNQLNLNVQYNVKEWKQIYKSPYIGPLKLLKKISLSTAFIATACVPFFVLNPTRKVSVSAAAKMAESEQLSSTPLSTAAIAETAASIIPQVSPLTVAVSTMVIATGWSSTALLSLLLRSYVIQLEAPVDTESYASIEDIPLKVTRLDFWSRPSSMMLHVSQLRPKSHSTLMPFVTYEYTDSVSGKVQHLFIHQELLQGHDELQRVLRSKAETLQ
ncbi:hypothetical protein MP228_005478 [Amoeboaphelidium protococcarum]|nr:hypothetical protein MP228_005478 [Amoeboaphelidium protococcarum]